MLMANISNRKNHMDNRKTYQCQYCPKTFREIAYKNAHEKSVHLQVKDIQCDQCDYTCSLKKHLQQHKIQNHSNISYTCDYPGCNKSYPIKGNYDAHRWRVHKIPRPKARKQ